MLIAWFFLGALSVARGFSTNELTLDQRLILSCHRVDIDGVIAALRHGANVNATFGDGNRKEFMDPWSLGWPLEVSHWTPLIALANSSPIPPPPRRIKNTAEDLEWAQKQQSNTPPIILKDREQTLLTITAILISHNADVDAYERFGETAIYVAARTKKLAFAKLLLRFNAKVTTATQTYVDGVGGRTPLHCAFWSQELTALLFKHGADREARDNSGKTPLDYVADPAIRKLYEVP
jgi:hypothetical protein